MGALTAGMKVELQVELMAIYTAAVMENVLVVATGYKMVFWMESEMVALMV